MPGIDDITQGFAQELKLVLAAQRGESSAFEELARRYTGMVFAVSYARTSDRETAEDLVQEVFLRAYTGTELADAAALFRLVVSRIARNLATDWQRSGRRRSRAVALLPLEEVSDPRAENALLKLETREQALNWALARLTPEERDIVLLDYAEDLSLTEISLRLNVHRTTVGRHMEQALERLRADVEPLIRGNCRAVRCSAKLPAKTAAAVAAFALLPAAARAQVVSQMTAAAKGATILNSISAAAAAGGALVSGDSHRSAGRNIGLGILRQPNDGAVFRNLAGGEPRGIRGPVAADGAGWHGAYENFEISTGGNEVRQRHYAGHRHGSDQRRHERVSGIWLSANQPHQRGQLREKV